MRKVILIIKKTYHSIRNANKFVRNTINWTTALIIAAAALCLWGCGYKNVEYYPVHMPVKCEIDMFKRPKASDNIVETNIEITKYAEELEAAILKCK